MYVIDKVEMKKYGLKIWAQHLDGRGDYDFNLHGTWAKNSKGNILLTCGNLSKLCASLKSGLFDLFFTQNVLLERPIFPEFAQELKLKIVSGNKLYAKAEFATKHEGHQATLFGVDKQGRGWDCEEVGDIFHSRLR